MQSNFKHFCVILPADFHEISRPENVSDEEIKIKHNSGPRHGCGSQILAFLRGSLTKLYGSRWVSCCQDEIQRRRKAPGVFHNADGVEISDKIGRDNPRIFSYAELFIGSNGFSEDQVLGSGGFGKVYKAVLPSDSTEVAVKCLAEKGQKFEKTFQAELAAVAHLRHKNLVRLRGWCVHEDQLHLVYDYMPNRSLDRILFRSPGNMMAEPLYWIRRRNIVRGLAAALHYLHEQLETQIIHRDVKTSNVMLDSNYNARLGDFGLARWLEHELEYQSRKASKSTKGDNFRLVETTRIGGTIGYLPPESFQKRSITTSKSDVFSFGIVVLEVVSGRRAIDLTYPDDQIILLDWIRRLSDEGKVLGAGDSRLRDGSYKLSELQHLIHIGLLCTLHEPQARPSMKWVVEALSDVSARLPALPSFHLHPLYISLSSSSDTSSGSTNTTTTATSSATDSNATMSNFYLPNFVTAAGETIYVTAEDRTTEIISSKSGRHQQPSFPETPKEFSYKEIVLATNNFSDSNWVAEMDFGSAYHGILDNDCQILVKRLGMKTCPALRERFSNELRNLGRLRHRNLVQLRGWCTELGEMLVIYDYSANRILSQHLLHHHNQTIGFSVLKWHQRYSIVKSLASAILYLHEEWDEQVIHRNITSSAVILEPDMNPRLTRFALAEFLARNEHGNHHVVIDPRKSARGIFGYMSPEYMESGQATTAADVYSFGVVVLEVVSGHMAVDFRQPEVLLVKKVHEFQLRKRPLKELADIRLNGEYNQRELMRLVKLGIACTKSNPQLRPSIRQIVSILDGNDRLIMEENHKERREQWKQKNACSLALVRRIQALGIQ